MTRTSALIADYLARGGTVTICPPCKHSDFVINLMWRVRKRSPRHATRIGQMMKAQRTQRLAWTNEFNRLAVDVHMAQNT